jgi:DNA-directed RNA polymerase specialized sigma24 family protein
MAADWEVKSRSPESRVALARLAHAEDIIASLGAAHLGDLVAGLRQPGNTADRDQAAHVLQAMLRSQGVHPLVPRAILQAILPGLVTVARRLSWGSGGDWDDGGAFFADAIATAWEVIVDWSGEDRDYAVLDLLSAIRCRLRRQMLSHRSGRDRVVLGLDPDAEARVSWSSGTTDLDELARAIDELPGRGVDPFDASVLYGSRVLGLTMTELAQMSGVSRQHLSGRRDRAVRKLLA